MDKDALEKTMHGTTTQKLALDGQTEPNALALEEVCAFIAGNSRRHLKTTMKTLKDRFTKAPYGFVEDDIFWLVARLFKRGDITLYVNDELVNAQNSADTQIIDFITKKAYLENRLEDRLRLYSKYKVLIIDEVGFLPIDKQGANMLFQLINKRYEKSTTIITTNQPFSKWAEVFGDPVLANAILDRLLHHTHVFNITGKSYRTKDILDLKTENEDKQ